MNIDRDDEYATRYEAAPTIEEQIEYQQSIVDEIVASEYPSLYKNDLAIEKGILASLEKLAALESQPVPVEPVDVSLLRIDADCRTPRVIAALAHIDALTSALQRAQEERDDAYEVADSESKGVWSETLLRYAKFNGEHLAVCFERNEYRERANKAEAELKLAQEERDKSCELLEALNEKSTALISVNERLKHRAEKAESLNRRMVELLKEPSEGMIAAGYPPNDERAQSWDVTEVFKAMSAELIKEME